MLLSKRIRLIVLTIAVLTTLHSACYADNFADEELEIYESIDSESIQAVEINSNGQDTYTEEIPRIPDAGLYYTYEDKTDDKKQLDNEPGLKEIDTLYSQGSNYDSLEQKDIYNTPGPKVDYEVIENPINLNEINASISKNYELIDLLSSVKIALNKNYNIQISSARKTSEKWRFAQACTNMLPDLTLGYNHSRYKGTVLVGGIIPATVTRTSVIPSFQAEAEVFKGFQNVFTALSAKHEYNASKMILKTDIESTIYDVAEAYYTLVKDKAKHIVALKTLSEAQAQLNLNKQRMYAGSGTKLDVLQSQSLVSKAEQSTIETQNSLKLSMVMFANLIGIDLFAELLPIEDKMQTKDLISKDINLEDMIDIALLNRPEVSRDQHYIKSLIMQRRASFSTYLPQATVSGGLQGSGDKISNVRRSEFISINLQWLGMSKLGTSGIIKSRELSSQLKEARLSLQNTIRDIQEDVISTYYSKQSTKKLLESTKSNIESSEEALRLAELRLKAGVGN